MKRTFIEATDFKEKIENLDEENLLQTIQNEILKDPETGVIYEKEKSYEIIKA